MCDIKLKLLGTDNSVAVAREKGVGWGLIHGDGGWLTLGGGHTGQYTNLVS